MTEVTHMEKETYFNFVRQQLTGIGRQPPEMLWHYTMGDTVVRIVESHQLWSTQLSCVNDQMELRHAGRLYRSALEEHPLASLTGDQQHLREELLLTTNLWEETATNHWFIICFSERQDDLSQWRAYGGGEGGYSVGFASSELSRIGLADRAYLAPVHYEADLQIRLANTCVEATFKFFQDGLTAPGRTRDQWTEDFLKIWIEMLAYIGPVIKHHAFQDEREWRVLRALRDEDFKNLKFTQKRTLLARHLPLSFAAAGSTAPHLPIRAVQVGPCRNPRVTQVSVGDLLRTHEYSGDIPVYVSEVPYQSL